MVNKYLINQKSIDAKTLNRLVKEGEFYLRWATMKINIKQRVS
jgi:hypothetical protein